MTWVVDHWRQDRKDPDLETHVRKHLRSATEFTWHDMNCELTPAQFDLDQLIAEREAMAWQEQTSAGARRRRHERIATRPDLRPGSRPPASLQQRLIRMLRRVLAAYSARAFSRMKKTSIPSRVTTRAMAPAATLFAIDREREGV